MYIVGVSFTQCKRSFYCTHLVSILAATATGRCSQIGKLLAGDATKLEYSPNWKPTCCQTSLPDKHTIFRKWTHRDKQTEVLDSDSSDRKRDISVRQVHHIATPEDTSSSTPVHTKHDQDHY